MINPKLLSKKILRRSYITYQKVEMIYLKEIFYKISDGHRKNSLERPWTSMAIT